MLPKHGKHLAKVAGALVVLVGLSAPAAAHTLTISLDPSDWEPDGSSSQGPGTLTQTGEGYLRATKTTATGGSAWAVSRQTVATYDLQNAVLRYPWRFDGLGSYAAIASGATSVYVFDPYDKKTTYYSTHHSWNGSEIITDNTWLYTEVAFSETQYDFTVSKVGFGEKDYLVGSGVIAATTWDALQSNHLWFRLIDSYAAGTYFELAEATIETPQAVPEPGSLALLASHAAGLAIGLSARRRHG